MIKVKANKELFLKLKIVTAKMNIILPGMMKNDIELSEDAVAAYFELWENLEDELSELYRLVDDWIFEEEEEE